MKKLLLAAPILLTALMAHDAHLYPHLGIGDVFVLSFLRLLLLAIPIVTVILSSKLQNRWLRIACTAACLLFIPYTIYSAAEIRHVADWCHTTPRTYFTDVCANNSWTLFPTFIYALAGTWAFVFSVSRLTRNHAVALALITYVSFATIFGLTTRINIWNAIRLPNDTIAALGTSMNSVFWLNVGLTAVFVTMIFYGWRQLRVDDKLGP